jgi:glycosyltransferase involved in cell wall biosynthesis
MVGTLPGFTMELGTDLTKVASAVRDLVQSSDDTLRSMAASDRVTPPAARPLVSVIVPVYEGAAFLPDAIRNIVSQEYPALEIIVVDDGSTQDIAAALRPLPVDVRLFRQNNAGAAAARNRGVRDASGEFIAFLDVDDLWPECNLDVLVDRLLAHPEADVVRGRAQLTTYAGAPEPGEFLGNPAEAFPHYIGAGLYRRRAFEKVGLFDPDLRFGEDTDWYTRAAERRLVIHQLEEVTLYVRRHADNMTRGKSLVELNQLRLFKKTLDRRRSQDLSSQATP